MPVSTPTSSSYTETPRRTPAPSVQSLLSLYEALWPSTSPTATLSKSTDSRWCNQAVVPDAEHSGFDVHLPVMTALGDPGCPRSPDLAGGGGLPNPTPAVTSGSA